MSGKAGIIILNYNTYDDTINCLESIDRWEKDQGDFVFYVVDNASPDNSGERLKNALKERENLCFLQSDKNLGFSGGNNIGIRQALEDGCEYLFLLNSDVILCNNAISMMTDIFEKNPEVAAVGPRVIDLKGEYRQFAKKPITLKTYICSKWKLSSVFPSGHKNSSYFKIDQNADMVFDGMVSGCCFGLRASFVKANDCLDDTVFLYYEEDILAYMITEAGKKTYLSSVAEVIHIGQVATQKAEKKRSQNSRVYLHASALYVLRKYAKTNTVAWHLLAAFNIVSWGLMSVFREDFRVVCRKYVAETRRLMKAAKEK